jgi:hypothetical protein
MSDVFIVHTHDGRALARGGDGTFAWSPDWNDAEPFRDDASARASLRELGTTSSHVGKVVFLPVGLSLASLVLGGGKADETLALRAARLAGERGSFELLSTLARFQVAREALLRAVAEYEGLRAYMQTKMRREP